MFIDNITKEDINIFLAQYDIFVTEFTKDNNFLYINTSNGGYGPQLELKLFDYRCKVLNRYREFETEFNKLWIKFLIKKFGQEYKNSLSKHLQKEAEELLNN